MLKHTLFGDKEQNRYIRKVLVLMQNEKQIQDTYPSFLNTRSNNRNRLYIHNVGQVYQKPNVMCVLPF